MQANKTFLYEVDNKTYEVQISYKPVKNINYRFRDGAFVVSCRRLTLMSTIKSGLDRFARTLIKRSAKKAPIGDDYIYLLGSKVHLTFPGEFTFLNASYSFKDMNDFLKQIKKMFLVYLTSRTAYYETEMNAPKYIIKIRDMKTRYGSNNRIKKTITYAFSLIHHPIEVIDSVIIHELTHCFVFDHSDNFYRLLYKYCPNYDMLRKKLIKAEFN